MARTRQTARKKKDSSPKKRKKAQSGQGPSAESSDAVDTSQTVQACEKLEVIQDSSKPTQDQQRVGEEGASVHQESESGSDSKKESVQAVSPVPPDDKSPPEEAGSRKRKKEDDDDISTLVGQSETETTTSPKKTKLSEGTKDSEHGESDQQNMEEVKGDVKQVESASDKSGGGTCETEKVGGDSDEAPEDLSLAEGKQIAMEQKQDESVQAQRLE